MLQLANISWGFFLASSSLVLLSNYPFFYRLQLTSQWQNIIRVCFSEQQSHFIWDVQSFIFKKQFSEFYFIHLMTGSWPKVMRKTSRKQNYQFTVFSLNWTFVVLFFLSIFNYILNKFNFNNPESWIQMRDILELNLQPVSSISVLFS
jgi:hypothetical protein